MSAPKSGLSGGASRTRQVRDVREVMDGLRRIVRGLRLSARAAEHEAGISGAQHFVLQLLAETPASSLNDLAERTFTDQSSVSVVVSRLVKEKLITRKSSEEDARRVELNLTLAGKRLLTRCPEPTQAKLLDGLERLTPKSLSALQQGLAALTAEMGISEEPPKMLFAETDAKSAGRAATKAPKRSSKSK